MNKNSRVETEWKRAVGRWLRIHEEERMDVQLAMFDMDGVLFDSMKNHAKSWHETMAHFGLTLPVEEAYLHEGRTGAGTINIVSLRERGHEATQQEINDIYAYKSQMFNALPTAEPMRGAYKLLQQVKNDGITPMVVTGSGQKTLLERLAKNFPGIFSPSLMVTAFDVKHGKPDPEPYLMGLQKMFGNAAGLSKHRAIVVENAPLGIEAAVAAGVFTIAVNTGPLPDQVLLDAGADLLFPSMQALCDAWTHLAPNFTTS